MNRIGDYEYDTSKFLGKGGCGTVYLGHNTKSGKKVAVKLVKAFPVDDDIKKEIEILKRLRHANIIKMHSYKIQADTLYFVMEYCPDGDLQIQIKKKYDFSDDEIRTFLQQTGSALKYINSQNIIHRDIKPANILISKSANVLSYKIADFGLAKLFEGTEIMTYCGTRTYFAPEIANRQPASYNADVYSLGITVQSMLRDNIKNPNLKDLFNKMTERDPKKRITISGVLEHRFFNETALVPVSIWEYDMRKCLGEGGCGKVYLGRNTKTGDQVAVKLVKAFPVDDETKKEIEILERLKHENIIEMYYNEIKGNSVYFVMKYCPDGDLQDKIDAGHEFSGGEIQSFLRQTGSALKYINSQKIIHRDIKPANILIKMSGNVLNYIISDFGLAKLFRGTEIMSYCGTHNYFAPEIENGKPASYNADVYSLGITIHTMCRGQFNNSSLKDLYNKMTERDPRKRLTISHVLDHPFMKGHVLDHPFMKGGVLEHRLFIERALVPVSIWDILRNWINRCNII